MAWPMWLPSAKSGSRTWFATTIRGDRIPAVRRGSTLSIATEILSLRRNQSSSVETLLALIDWEYQASEPDHRMRRHFEVLEAADAVLMNVAAHAAEAEKNLASPGARRAMPPMSRRRYSRTGPPPRLGLWQRKSFCVRKTLPYREGSVRLPAAARNKRRPGQKKGALGQANWDAILMRSVQGHSRAMFPGLFEIPKLNAFEGAWLADEIDDVGSGRKAMADR